MPENHHVLITFDKVHNPLRWPRETTSEQSGPNMLCFVHFDLEMCLAPQWRALFRHLSFQKCSEASVLYIWTWKYAWRHKGVHFFDISTSKSAPKLVFCTFGLGNMLGATKACTFSTSQLPKVLRSWCVLYSLTWKYASRHNRVHFFDISTSKSAPKLVFCTFGLGNMLGATKACTFSTSQLPKVLRSWCALYSLTWKYASRNNGVQLFISHLATWLCTRSFSEPTFRPSGAINHWKNTVFRDFPTFSRTWIFFLLRVSLL